MRHLRLLGFLPIPVLGADVVCHATHLVGAYALVGFAKGV